MIVKSLPHAFEYKGCRLWLVTYDFRFFFCLYYLLFGVVTIETAVAAMGGGEVHNTRIKRHTSCAYYTYLIIIITMMMK